MQGVPFKEGHHQGIFVVLVVSSDLSVGPNLFEVFVDTFEGLFRPEAQPVLRESLLLLPGQVLFHMDLMKKK